MRVSVYVPLVALAHGQSDPQHSGELGVKSWEAATLLLTAARLLALRQALGVKDWARLATVLDSISTGKK
jgi:hypothetical protein